MKLPVCRLMRDMSPCLNGILILYFHLGTRLFSFGELWHGQVRIGTHEFAATVSDNMRCAASLLIWIWFKGISDSVLRTNEESEVEAPNEVV